MKKALSCDQELCWLRRLNLASFVTTWMEPEAISLITDSLNVNYVVGAGTDLREQQH